MKKRCLAVCAHPPSGKALQAGHRIAFDFISQLARDCDLDLLLVINSSDVIDFDELHEAGVKEVMVYRVGYWEKLRTMFSNILSIPPRFASRASAGSKDKLLSLVRREKYHQLYFEFSQVAPLALYVDGDAVLSIHDVQLQVVLRSNLVERFLFSAFTYCYEAHLLGRFKEIFVLCEKDQGLLTGLYGSLPIVVRKPTLSEFVKAVVRNGNYEPYSLLFWGAMNRVENEQAVIFFVNHIMPKILHRQPRAKLYVVGNAPSAKVMRLQSDKVVVTGFVDNPAPYFSRASLGVVPLLRGAGIKIKTLELLAAGIPVVSTPVGAEGVGSSDNLTVAQVEDFAMAILNVWNVCYARRG